jgi:hypothetical protein
MGQRFPSVEPGTSLAERRLRALERIASVLSWTVAIAAISLVVWTLGDVLLLIFAAALLPLGFAGWQISSAELRDLGPAPRSRPPLPRSSCCWLWLLGGRGHVW